LAQETLPAPRLPAPCLPKTLCGSLSAGRQQAAAMGASRRCSRTGPQQSATGGKAQAQPRSDTTPMAKAVQREAVPAPEIAAATSPALPPLPSEEEVIAAMASLYDDELKPYGRILRKRLAEHAGAGGCPAQEVDGARLRVMCEGCRRIRVEAEDGGEWSALLVDRPDRFIDVYDTVDVYPEDLWEAAAVYFEGLDPDDAGAALPGGRYASAQALACRDLPFLQGRSLGQVCHITQLAISQRKMLGYFNGAIVPYSRSTSRLKLCCAQEQRAVSSKALAAETDGGAAALPVAQWDVARSSLREILEGALRKGADQVPLSNVKRIFRSVYHMELSETALGHAKLSDLLQDTRFEDICSVQLQDRGYAVLPAASLREAATHLLRKEADMAPPPASERSSPPCWPRLLSEDMGSMVQRTFIHAVAPPPTPPAGRASRRSTSLPKDLTLGSPGMAQREEVDCQDADASEGKRLRFCPDEPLCMEDAMEPCEASHAFPAMTPSPSPQYFGTGAASAPLLLQPWAAQGCLGSFDFGAPPFEPAPAEPRRVQFCPDEPLCLEEAGPSPTEEAWASPAFDAWTPSPQNVGGHHRRLNLLLAAEEPRVVRIAGLV